MIQIFNKKNVSIKNNKKKEWRLMMMTMLTFNDYYPICEWPEASHSTTSSLLSSFMTRCMCVLNIIIILICESFFFHGKKTILIHRVHDDNDNGHHHINNWLNTHTHTRWSLNRKYLRMNTTF